MNCWALLKPFLQWSGQPHRPENQPISLTDSVNIGGLASKKSLIAGGRDSFIPMIERRLRRHSIGQSALANPTAQYPACDARMEGTDGITRWPSLCVILGARSFSG